MSSLIDNIKQAQKNAMKARDKARLGTLRMLLAEVKQREIDGQTTLDESGILAVVTKMVKQRRDAATQFDEAGRDDLASAERAEITVLEDFLPKQLSDDEIGQLIDDAIASTGASSMADMGKLMGSLKPKLAGRADMGKVSGLVKARLG